MSVQSKAISRSKYRLIVYHLVMFSLMLVICFVILEYGFAKFYYTNVSEIRDKEFDPQLGWLYKADTYWVKPEHRFRKHSIYINEYGLRNRDILFNNKRGVSRILILGDSFTFARAINKEAIFSSQLERILNKKLPDKYEVINGGVEGFGNAQELLLMRKLADKNIVGDIYLLMLFTNDILDNLCLTYDDSTENLIQPRFDFDSNNKLVLKRAPQKEISDSGNLIPVRDKLYKIRLFETLKLRLESFVQTKPKLISFFNKIGLNVKFPRMPGLLTGWYREDILKDGIPLSREIIKEIKYEAEKHKAELYVAMIPSPIQVYSDTYGPLLKRTFPDNRQVANWLKDKLRPQAVIGDICKELSIPFLDLFPILHERNDKELFVPREGHFTKNGHNIVADSLAKFVLEGFHH